MPQTRARSTNLTQMAHTMYPQSTISPSPYDSAFSDSTDKGDIDPTIDDEVSHLEDQAKKTERQAKFVEDGIKSSMKKIEDINKAHLNISNIVAREKRALADEAKDKAKLATIEARLNEIALTTNAISDKDLRSEFDILTENKIILEHMLSRVPEQLAVLRESFPLAISAAMEVERGFAGIVDGLVQWRVLGANLDKWVLDEKGQIGLLGSFKVQPEGALSWPSSHPGS